MALTVNRQKLKSSIWANKQNCLFYFDVLMVETQNLLMGHLKFFLSPYKTYKVYWYISRQLIMFNFKKISQSTVFVFFFCHKLSQCTKFNVFLTVVYCQCTLLNNCVCRSLGVLLYTLVYGAMPFDGSNFKRLVKQITTGDYYEPKQPACKLYVAPK